LLGGAEDEADPDPGRDADDEFDDLDDVADELCDLECDGRCDAELDVPPCAGVVRDPLEPDAVGDDPFELNVRAVRIASTTTTMTEAAKASRRRQYTDGGRSPTGRNMSRTPYPLVLDDLRRRAHATMRPS